MHQESAPNRVRFFAVSSLTEGVFWGMIYNYDEGRRGRG